MKQPLIISCRGSEEVRSKCAPLLEKQLQSVSLQWRRSEAEFPIQIQLNVKFVAYLPTLIRRRESRWQDVAAAHLYFMDCWDSEKYRLDVRSDLIEWFATLRDADTNDWLVVFDACKARESRGRGHVLEKLRSDLSKYVNRIVEIDSASYKMPVLVRALADQALISFDYWAQLFEANLKTERDACFSLDWSFINYMVTQVQYSRLLLSVNVFEQSLAQLDELDAMLSLLASHYAASATKSRWIESFCIPSKEQIELVSLVAMYSRFDDEVRQLLAQTNLDDNAFATDLRRIRALIFSCQLSVILNRYASQSTSAETACQRVIWYGAVLVQAIRKEEAILTGLAENQARFRLLSNALWCLEVLHFAGRLCDLAVVASESESMCTLWMTLCRMVQNLDPTQSTTDTSAWFSKRDETSSESDSPLAVLEKCMADNAAYDEHFVKWHESALAMLKHYGWRRHARTIGIALADFYRRRGKDVDSLHLFLKLARQLEEERWCQAYIGLLLTIGDDLLKNCTLRERLKFFGDLSCAHQFLPIGNSSTNYCSRFKNEFVSDWTRERILNSPVCPWFSIRSIKPDRKSILCGSDFRWTVVVENRFPESMPLYSTSLCCSISPDRYEAVTSADKPQKTIIAKPKKLMNDFRRESTSAGSDSADCSEFYTMDVKGRDSQMAPGRNVLEFRGKCSQFGSCVPEHLHIRLGDDGRLDVQVRAAVDQTSQCFIKIVEPEVVLVSPSSGQLLWAGVTQTITLRLMAGAVSEKPEEEETLLQLETENADLQLATSSEADDETQCGSLLVKVPTDLSPGASFEIEQTLFCNIHGSNESRTCQITSRWRGRTFRHELNFKPVFHWMSNLKVIAERLLLTITLHNDGQRPLVLNDPKLTFTSTAEKGGDVDAELLNDGLEQDLYFATPFTLAWYVPPGCSSAGVIVFHYRFKDEVSDTYTCYADVELQRPAIVEACCQMASEKIVCRVGTACDFVVSLKALDQSLRSVDVFVTLTFETRFWACTGSLSELIRLKENGLGQAFFQVIPQCVGFLPMPAVEIQLSGEAALTKACQAYVRSKGKQVHVLAPLSNFRRSFNEHSPRTPLDIQL